MYLAILVFPAPDGEDKTKRIPRRFNLSISSYNYLFLGLLNGKSLSEKNIELLSLSLDRVFFLV
mgnify:FL=1